MILYNVGNTKGITEVPVPSRCQTALRSSNRRTPLIAGPSHHHASDPRSSPPSESANLQEPDLRRNTSALPVADSASTSKPPPIAFYIVFLEARRRKQKWTSKKG